MSHKDDTMIDDLIHIVSLMPWWVGLMLAPLSYILMHTVAGIDIEYQVGSGVDDTMGPYLAKKMAVTFAFFAQMILPFVFAIGALVSAYKQRKNNEERLNQEKQGKNKPSKLTQVLLNDLKGPRRVHQDATTGKVKGVSDWGKLSLEHESAGANERRQSERSKTKKERSIYFKAWAITSIVMGTIILMVGTLAFLGVTGGIVSMSVLGNLLKPEKEIAEKITPYQEKKKAVSKQPVRKAAIEQKKRKVSQKKDNSGKEIKKAPREKKDQLYSWTDKDGTVHFTNDPKGREMKTSTLGKARKVVTNKGYMVILKNGKSFNCKNVTATGDILSMRTKEGLQMNIHKNEIEYVEHLKLINDKLTRTIWEPFKRG